MLTLATDVATSRTVIALAEKYPGIVYAAIGIHPESVHTALLNDINVLRELAAHAAVVAIGEIGLDYYWDKTTKELQQTFFEAQLTLAAELNLPVAIHDREAHAVVLGTLQRMCPMGGSLRGVLHAFSGDLAMAQAAFELGFLVSFGGPITFKNNRTTPDLIRALPLQKILIETDSPYLTPHPHRGKRNEPMHVKLVAEKIAGLKDLSNVQVATQTTINAQTLFRIP